MDLFPEIPGYRIEKKLAGGRISEIYLGVQEDLNRQVAIKVLNPELFNDVKLLDNFQKESKRISKFTHTSIADILDAGDHNGLYYIVTDYLPRSLRTRIKRKFGLDGLPPAGNEEKSLLGPQLIHLLREVAWALDYAHGQGVIHMDIRPDNIRFREDGSPVVIGFFMSRVLANSELLRKKRIVTGTPHYISPEQALRKPLEPCSDIYSLGVTLYESLTGKVPYDADEVIAIENQHIMEPVPNLPNDQSHFQPLLDAMMEKTQEERIQSASQLIEMLDDAAINVPSIPTKPKQRDQIPQQMPLTSGPREFDFTESVPLDFSNQQGQETASQGADKMHSSSTHPPQQGDGAVPHSPQVDLDDFEDDHPITSPRDRMTFKKPTKEGFDMDRIKELLANPKISIPIAAVVVLAIVLLFVLGGGSGEDAGSDGNGQITHKKPLTKEEQELADRQYKYKLSIAQKLLKKGDFDNALQRLKEAEVFKKTDETKAMAKDIQEKQATKQDEDAYKQATKTGTPDSFEAYLQEYPSGIHRTDAEEMIKKLKEEARKREAERQRILAAAVHLRSQSKLLDLNDVKQMIRLRGFFDKYYNKTGNFINHFQSKSIGEGENKERVIIDYSTALVWHATGSPNYMKLEDAHEWLRQLNEQNYAGYKDWRLPTLEEAASLMEEEEGSGGLFIDNIFGREQKYIWTSDTVSDSKVWAVDFFSGDVNRVDTHYEAFIRPVRSLRSD